MGKKKMEMWFQSLNCDYFLIIMTFLLQINAALFLILSISCLYVCFCVCVYVLLIWGGCLSLVEIQMQSHANKQNINVIQTAKQNQRYFTIHKNHYVLFALLGFDCIYICSFKKQTKHQRYTNSKTKAVFLTLDVLFALLSLCEVTLRSWEALLN